VPYANAVDLSFWYTLAPVLRLPANNGLIIHR
jgi:hypothetical protein